MEIIEDISETQRFALKLRTQGKRIAFVPTMGYLHRGHLSLVDEARKRGDAVAASIFVNPLQFNNPTDLEKYPRDMARDTAMLREAGVDFVFTPTVSQIYPSGFQSYVVPGALSELWEGAHRPGHFRGVTTVVALLFMAVQPHFAIFGEKDFQQLRIIEQMVKDLRFPIEIVRGVTVRDDDGLAMSSRNVRLNEAARADALLLSRALKAAQEAYRAGEREGSKLAQCMNQILSSTARVQVDYAQVVEEESLLPCDQVTQNSRLIIAAQVDGVRLIDNARVGGTVR